MNTRAMDILISLSENKFNNQRAIAEYNNCSLGMVNKTMNMLIEEEYINTDYSLTKKAEQLIGNASTKRAVILAAGLGLRTIPINIAVPKGLIEINGEKLIERLIDQLHGVGVNEIYVVVGYMKESFEYLIDKYDVSLVVNKNYQQMNNIQSVNLVKKRLSDCYVVPCDLYFKNNPFNRHELYSWYMISEEKDICSTVRLNKKNELVRANVNNVGNRMIGLAYVSDVLYEKTEKSVSEFINNPMNFNSFWEDCLFDGNKFILDAKTVKEDSYIEINTYDDLLNFDDTSDQLKTDAIDVIAESLECDINEIHEVIPLKKGMTNRSFSFICRGQKYIMRIPGEGTDQLINRKEEADVYSAIKSHRICDDIIYINPINGYKLTKFIENARVCDPENSNDLKKCIKRLKDFHELGLKVNHEFNVFEQIEFYESLWGGNKSAYGDYETTKQHVFELKEFTDKNACEKSLTHIDAVPDNFMIYTDENGNECVKLIDWEYAGMQDPHVDIAMFSIYSMYTREQIDNLIDIYFENGCSEIVRLKIYCYVAACGLLWSNWCEYKRQLGVEFGEYSLAQYRYAKNYYKIFIEEKDRIIGGID